MIGLLQVGRDYGQTRLRAAIKQAIALGCSDSAAVRHLVTVPDQNRVTRALFDVGTLARFERPLPDATSYDQLLPAGSAR